jgi:anti-sigma B factor antagonist
VIAIEHLRDSTFVCRPLGDLDVAAAAPLRQVVRDLARPGLTVIIDLSRVTFMDATGASALVRSVQRVRATGGTVVIRHANPRLQCLLSLLGADRLFMKTAGSCHPGAA